MRYLDSTLAKSAFEILSCRGKNLSSKLKKRPKSGHESSLPGVCLACFGKKRHGQKCETVTLLFIYSKPRFE